MIVVVTFSCRSLVISVHELRFLQVSPMKLAWQSQHLILYTAPSLPSGLSLSLKLVSSRRKLVIGLCTTRML